jgi:hypothetical protein
MAQSRALLLKMSASRCDYWPDTKITKQSLPYKTDSTANRTKKQAGVLSLTSIFENLAC